MHRPHARLRRCASAAVLAIGVLLSAASAARAQGTPTPAGRDTRPTVAVLYFDNSALKNHADYDPLCRGMADMIITELSRNPAIRVVERDKIQKVLEEQNLGTTGRIDPTSVVRVGKILGAHHLVTGSFFIDPRGKQLRLDARALRTETMEVEYVETVNGKPDELLNLVSALAIKMNGGMRLPPMPAVAVAPQPPAGNPTPKPPAGRPAVSQGPPTPRPPREGDFNALMLYSRGMAAEDSGDLGQAIKFYKATLSQMPGYEPALRKLARLQQQRAGG